MSFFLWTFSVPKFRHYGAKDGDDSDDDGKDGDDGDDSDDEDGDDGKDGDDDGDDGKDGDDGDGDGGDGDVRHLRSPDLRIISSHHRCQSLCQRHEG